MTVPWIASRGRPWSSAARLLLRIVAALAPFVPADPALAQDERPGSRPASDGSTIRVEVPRGYPAPSPLPVTVTLSSASKADLSTLRFRLDRADLTARFLSLASVRSEGDRIVFHLADLTPLLPGKDVVVRVEVSVEDWQATPADAAPPSGGPTGAPVASDRTAGAPGSAPAEAGATPPTADPLLEQALWRARRGDFEGVRSLLGALLPQSRARVLAEFGGGAGEDAGVLALLEDRARFDLERDVRLAAIRSLGGRPSESAAPVLARLWRVLPEAELRGAAMEALVSKGDHSAVAALVDLAFSDSLPPSADGAGHPAKQLVAALQKLLLFSAGRDGLPIGMPTTGGGPGSDGQGTGAVRAEAISALVRIARSHSDAGVRERTIALLPQLAPAAAVPFLEATIADPAMDTLRRSSALASLSFLACDEASEALARLAASLPEEALRAAAERSLKSWPVRR
ncbi:MAG: HEAT repeat domain-containing protein [Planctomycetes bacterium]|nr:HEAT repeat domain-containing protein [Planctomycetota bacterium]